MSDPATRAEAARRKILASGDPELIRRLHLLEATAPAAAAPPPPAAAPSRDTGPGLLGMGLAVAGGAWLGTVLGGLTLSGEMSRAFAEVAEDLGIDLTGVDMAALSDPASGSDLHSAAGAPDAGSEGDLFDGLGDFFDL